MLQNEFHHQVAVANHIKLTYPNVCWTASCGGMRTSMGTAKKMKMMGYIRGCPDIMIFEPRGTFHGLFIELKVPAVPSIQKAGKIENHQVEFLGKLERAGFQALIAFGAREAIEIIDRYMDS
jgi:hypothetical protein